VCGALDTDPATTIHSKVLGLKKPHGAPAVLSVGAWDDVFYSASSSGLP
jgi:hypothetical protein